MKALSPPFGSPLGLPAAAGSQDHHRTNPPVLPPLAAAHLAELERILHDVGQGLLEETQHTGGQE